MIEENINIIKKAEVTEIILEDKKVKGVQLNNSETINYDYIVCNSILLTFIKFNQIY